MKVTPDETATIERQVHWYETQAAGLEDGRYTAVHHGNCVAKQLAKTYRECAASGRATLARINSELCAPCDTLPNLD